VPTVAPDVHAGTNVSNIAHPPEDLEVQLEKARTPQAVGVIHDSAGNRVSAESPSLTGELLDHERSAEARSGPEYKEGTITRAPDGTVELTVAPGQVRVFDSEENAQAAKAEIFPEPTAPEEEAAARVAIEPPTYGPPAPVTRRTMTQALKTLTDRLGKRFDYLVANPRQLPMRYRAALKAQGIDYNNYEAFFDRTTGDFVVNPNAFVDEGHLADAVIRKFLPNSFSEHGIVIPIDSWSQVANVPAVARRARPRRRRLPPDLGERQAAAVADAL